MENNIDRAIIALGVALMVLVAGVQAYKAGERQGRSQGYYAGYAGGCTWADHHWPDSQDDEALARCMEDQPDKEGQ